MKKSVYTVWAALLGAGMMLSQAQPVLAQDVTIDGAPVVLTVSAPAEAAEEGALPAEGGEVAAEGSEGTAADAQAAAATADKEVDSFRIFGETQDGRMLIRTDGGDEYISKDELSVLLPELALDGFPIMEETAALGQGSNGEEVITLQQVLTDLGYLEGDIDGSYGGGTAEAVSKFQEERGLDPTGNADIYTMMLIKAIDAGLEESVTVSSKGFESPEEKFPEIVENTAADLEAFMEPRWRWRFDEATQTGAIDPGIALGTFAVEAPAIDKISGTAAIKLRVTKDEATGVFALTPAIVVETESASRPYMQGAALNTDGSAAVRLEETETTGELNGITMYETSYIKLTPEAFEALAAGEVKSITLQGKNKSYDVDVNVDAENMKAFAEACEHIGA